MSTNQILTSLLDVKEDNDIIAFDVKNKGIIRKHVIERQFHVI
jgi:hypothetical protein